VKVKTNHPCCEAKMDVFGMEYDCHNPALKGSCFCGVHKNYRKPIILKPANYAGYFEERR
jgi:hypothetical protein